MFLDVNSSDSELDMGYFKQLIKSKTEKDQLSYGEQLAARNMGQQCDPEEELSTALSEIRKNEKEMTMIAMVAQTLIDRQDGQQEKMQEYQSQVRQMTSKEENTESKYSMIKDSYQELKSQYEKLNQIREDINEQLKTITQKKVNIQQRYNDLWQKRQQQEDLNMKSEQSFKDKEVTLKQEKKTMQDLIDNLNLKVDNIEKINDNQLKALDSKEKMLSQMKVNEKQLLHEIKKNDKELRTHNKRSKKNKDYIKSLEEQVMSKNDELKKIKEEQKNKDLSNQIEAGAVNELGDIDSFMLQRSATVANLGQKFSQVTGQNAQGNVKDGEDPLVAVQDVDDEDIEILRKSDIPTDSFFENQNNEQEYQDELNDEMAPMERRGAMVESAGSQDGGQQYGYQNSNGSQGSGGGMNFDDRRDRHNSGLEYTDLELNNQYMGEDIVDDLDQFDQGNYRHTPSMIDQEVQTEIQASQEMQTQTNEIVNKEMMCQTTIVEYVDEDCQTTTSQQFHVKVQANIKPNMKDMETSPDEEIEGQANKDLEKTWKKEQSKKKLTLGIMDSSGEHPGNKPIPHSTQNTSNAFKFDASNDMDGASLGGSPSTISYKEQKDMEYHQNRDPMNEFFTLTCQSIKLNSPHLNMISMIDTMVLYQNAQKEDIPFFKWANYIEEQINKEFFKTMLKNQSVAKKKKKKTTNAGNGKSVPSGTQADNPYNQPDDEQDMFFESGLTMEKIEQTLQKSSKVQDLEVGPSKKERRGSLMGDNPRSNMMKKNKKVTSTFMGFVKNDKKLDFDMDDNDDNEGIQPLFKSKKTTKKKSLTKDTSDPKKRTMTIAETPTSEKRTFGFSFFK